VKNNEIETEIMSGACLAVGEFRDWEVKEMPNEKAPGTFNVVETHFVLHGRDVLQVRGFLPKGTRAADAKRPAFKVGDRLAIRVRSWEQSKWGVRVGGSVEALVVNGSAGAK